MGIPLLRPAVKQVGVSAAWSGCFLGRGTSLSGGEGWGWGSSDCPYAGGHAEGGEDGGEDGDDGLNDVFPSFFVHGEVIMDFEISYFEFSR